MSDNLVDSMLEEMHMNNNPADISYAPAMGGQQGYGQGAPPIQPQGHLNGGAPGYDPQMQQMPPQMTSSQAQMDMYQDGEPDDDEMMVHQGGEVPDMGSYGMNEESTWVPKGLVDSFKDPIMVIILAVLLSLPQVNRLIRGTLSQFVGNPMYVNILMAVMLGLAFYLLKMIL
jgi:hypothetical protein